MIFNSIRWRLQLWHGLILAVIVAGFGVTAYQLESAQRLRTIDDDLQRRSGVVTSLVRPDSQADGGPSSRPPGERDLDGPRSPPPDDGPAGPPPGNPPRNSPPPQRTLADFYANGGTNDFYFAVWNSNGRLQSCSTNAPDGLALPPRGGGADWQGARTRGAQREFVRFTPTERCILVGRSIAAEQSDLRRLAWLLIAAGGAVLALGLAGGWWVASRAMKPISDISETAERITTGDLSQRISATNTKNELGQLAAVLNSTFARLEKSFAQQKQFTADAAHELRTPLAVLISEAQTTLARERSSADYRDTIEANLDTAQQMRKLTDSLMQLARFDSGQENIRRDAVDLADVARDCVKLLHPLADARGQRIVCELSPVTALADAELLKRVVSNLVSNAIQYNKPGGELRIATNLTGNMPTLTVADTGTGITPEDLPHIFERFYRADKSRTRSNGNSGLGLSICKAIVNAHGGSIEVASRVDEGTQFTVRLPASTMTAANNKNGDPLPDRRS